MSSDTVGQNDADENVKIALKRAKIKGSQQPYSSQWMDHWMQSGSNSTHQIQKGFTVPGTGNNSEFREAKMLSIEVMRSKITEYRDIWCSEPGKNYVHSDIHLEKGIVDDKKIDSLSNNKDASADWKKLGACHFRNSENMNFEWNHFPMFDINRKVECILSSKKKSKCDTMAIRMTESQFWDSESVLASHAVKFASEEHRFQICSMAESTDHGTSSSKSAEDSPSNQVDNSGPVFNYHRLNMAAPPYTSKQVSPLSSRPPCDIVNKETYHTFLEHDQYNSCKRSTFPPCLPSEMKDDNQMWGRSTSQFKNKTVQLQTTCYQNGISFPILIHERDKEILSDSNKVSPSHDCEPGLSKFTDFRSPNQHKILKFSDSTQYFPLTQKTRINLSSRGKIIQEPINSATSKETAYIEATALSAMSLSHERRTASLKLLENSISSEDQDGSGTNPNTVKNQFESSVKTKRIHNDASQSPACTAGVNSSRPQKQTSSLAKEAIVRCAESDLPLVNQHLKDSEIRESSSSKTDSMGEDHILCQVEKMDNLESTRPVESSLCLESSNRWVKRLRHDPPEYFADGSKRLKLADALGTWKGCTLYNGVLNCRGSSSYLPSSSKEQNESDKAKEKGECSSKEHTKTVNSWIRRWCYSSQQTTTPQMTQTVLVHTKMGNTKTMPERTEVKQLPSLAAMALMGRAVSSFRPCEFQRRGSSVVWNTEEL